MYTLFGYDIDCNDFEIKYDSFVAAVKAYFRLESSLCVVCIRRDYVGSCRHVSL